MRVLQINSVVGVGSTGKIAADLHEELEAQGHESYVAYGRNESRPISNSIKIGSQTGILWHVFISRVFDSHGFGSVIATKKLIKKIREIDPDLIHLHNIHGYYLNIRVLFNYLKKRDIPVLWTLHDCWAFTGHCAYFDYAGCDKWREGCYKCPQKKTYPKSLLFDRSKINYREKKKIFTSLKNVTLVTPSYWMADVVKKSFLNIYSVNPIYNGLDLNSFKPTSGSFRKDKKIEDKIVLLGVASPWSPRKGLNIFVELSKMLDENYQIVLVGLSSAQMKTIPDNIIGIARTNNIEELAHIYTTADYLLNPSAEETMGLVTVEAHACGTPAIVSNKTAVPEMVNEKCGIVVSENTAAAFYDAITSNKKVFSKSDCLDHASGFEKKLKYSEYIEMYKKIVEK